MADWDPVAWENALIEEMRANGGSVVSGPLAGHPLMVVTSTGAKSGLPRRSILTFSRDGDAFIVAGTASGSPVVPAWVHNMRANPAVDVEAEGRTWSGTATVVDDPTERDRLWEQHVARLPWFAEYPEQAGRVIPIVRVLAA